jgi:hypothetical protein
VATDGYILTKSAADWVARNSQLRTGLEAPELGGSYFEPTAEPHIFYNDSSETVPAYGIIRISGIVSSGGRSYYKGDKPASSLGWFAVNGSRDVAAGEYGPIQTGIYQRVLYDSADSPSNGRAYGVSGFKARSYPTGQPLTQILIHGIYDSTNYVLRASVVPFTSIMIKAPAGGIPGRVGSLVGAAICDVLYQETSSEQIGTSTTQTKVYNWSTSAACATGDRYGVAARIDNRWMIVAEDCNDEGSTVGPGTGSGSGGKVAEAIDTSTITPAVSTGQFYNVTFTGTGTGSGPA